MTGLPRSKRSTAGSLHLVFAFLAVLTMAACSSHPAAGIVVERFDVRVDVQADGSLIVHEEIRVGATDQGSFRRVVEAPESDEVTFAGASLNGQPLQMEGRNVRVRDGRSLTVEWPPAHDAGTHVLALDYRVAGALKIEERRGRLRWPALPAGRAYRIDTSTLILSLPETAQIFPDTGIAEAGWAVERLPRGVQATRSGIGFEGATILADISVDPAVTGVPDWQVTLDMRRQFAPAFVSGGLFMLVIGGGIIWIIRFQHPARQVPENGVDATAGRADLPPALAAAVRRPGPGSTYASRAATLLDLERQGKLADGRSGAAQGRAAPVSEVEWEHERVLLQRLPSIVAPASVAAELKRLARPFDVALMRDALNAGLLDPERLTVRDGLRTTAWVGAVVSLVCAGVVHVALARFGWWPQIIPACMLLVSGALWSYGRRFSAWTEQGAQANRYWRARFAALGAPQPRAVSAIDHELPVAFAAGLGRTWLARYGGQLPEARHRLALALAGESGERRRP